MKKIFASTIVLILLAMNANAQYEPGDIDISVGAGFGLYGAKASDGSQDSSGVNAGSGLLNLGVNYAILDKLALGVGFERNGFLTQNDSTDSDTYGYSYNYRLNLNYRFVNSAKNSLSIQSGAGISSFKFGDRKSGETVSGNGFTYEFDLMWQHYFGEHVGMFLNAGYVGYIYNELRNQDGDLWIVDENSDAITFSLSGVNARIGLQFKL